MAAKLAGVWVSGLLLGLGLLACGGAGPEAPPARAELPPSAAKELTDFRFEPADNPGLTELVRGQIDGARVSVSLPAGVGVTALVPRLAYTGVRALPASGEPRDFSQAVSYTIFAADGSRASYAVLASSLSPSEAPEPERPQEPAARSTRHEITRFALAGVAGVIEGDRIEVSLPSGTDLSALAPEVSFEGADLQPSSSVIRSFSAPVTYTVTAEDGSTRVYTVSARVLPAPAEITAFSLGGVSAELGGDEIRLTVPHGTRIVNVTPRVEFRGVALSPAPGTLVDFSQPVVFTVTSADGGQRSYVVRVSVAPNLNNEITHFKIFYNDASIDGERIELRLPYGTLLTSLVPQITLSGGTVEPASGVAQDFTQPVMYKVTAQDGSTRTYTVVISVAASSACSMSEFRVPGGAALIGSGSVRLLLPYASALRGLAPQIVHEGAEVRPASGEAQDFTQPVEYTVTAADGTQCRYLATATTAETTDRGIERFAALGSVASIQADVISLVVPANANLDALTPEIIHHGARLTPGSGVVLSFSDPVRYTLLELSGELHVYTVTVTRAAVSDTTLTSLSVLGRAARIQGGMLSVELPYGTDLRAVAPTLTHLGARVSPVSGTTRDLTRDVTYTVIAVDGTRRDYVLRAHVAAPDEKRLTDFALAGVPASIAGERVDLVLPAGTDLRALRPSLLQHDGASLQPAADTIRDFTQPVRYTVTAADGSSAEYVVNASVQP